MLHEVKSTRGTQHAADLGQCTVRGGDSAQRQDADHVVDACGCHYARDLEARVRRKFAIGEEGPVVVDREHIGPVEDGSHAAA